VNGGPGNQVIGIKEALIIAHYSSRVLICPPIVQHYTMNLKKRGDRNNIKYWEFDDIFQYEPNQIIARCDIQLQDIPTKIIGMKHKSTKSLRVHKCWDIENKLDVIGKSYKLDTVQSIEKFSSIYHKQECIILSELYNNIKISDCYWNGCDTCGVNPGIQDLYHSICSKLDFSQCIHVYAANFISHFFNNVPFIALHIRYPDIDRHTPMKQLTKSNYDERDILRYIHEHFPHVQYIFIATSNQDRISKSCLSKYQILPTQIFYNEKESFIEQCICTKATHFLYTGAEMAKPQHTHIRSTWTSFVIDYRLHMLNISPDTHVYLPEIFQKDRT
jgi:hypothetical protein